MTHRPRIVTRALCALIPALLIAPLLGQGNELDFLAPLPDARSYREMLSSYLKQKAFAALEDRERGIARLSTAAAVDEHRRRVRERLIEALGGFPERTPLNARTVGTLERDDFRIEKVIFESQPKFYVTANLYLPKTGRAPYPAILFPLGHESGAKAHEAWQYALGSFATTGFVALAWDRMGHGERAQFFTTDTRRYRQLNSTRAAP